MHKGSSKRCVPGLKTRYEQNSAVKGCFIRFLHCVWAHASLQRERALTIKEYYHAGHA